MNIWQIQQELLSIFDELEDEETNTRTLIEEINKKLDKPSLMRASEVKKK